MKNKDRGAKIKIIIVAVFVLFIAVFAIGKTVYDRTYGTWELAIVLNGDREMTLEYGTEWTDPGASATLTGKHAERVGEKDMPSVKTEGTVDTYKTGTYEVKYLSSYDGYALHLRAQETRIVKVQDTVPPEIVLNGDEQVSFVQGEAWDDPGASASDNADGDLTGEIRVEGTVDGETPGTYTLTYVVSDKSGNQASVTRTVNVKTTPETDPAEGKSKVIYLTFDDGPSPYTERLLGVLDKYGVKVTFFVTGQSARYRNLIGTAASKGHSIGVHTMTHNYATIYASPDAFWSDFEQIQAIVQEQTGSRTDMMRFPGGSSNTVSASCCPGIMTVLTKEAEARGYTYFDWNVSSGDGGGPQTPENVMNNIINNVQKHDVSVVLCHDTKDTTVDAMEQTIDWCLKNGYTFLPMNSASFAAHHGVNN